MTPFRRRGFSLIELIVAIGILALLFGLLLSALQLIRESARRTECQNLLRQQGLAVMNYESAHGRLPPGSVQGPFELLGVPSDVSHSLWALLLPHLDEGAASGRYRLDVSYSHPANAAIINSRILVLECRNAPRVPDQVMAPADFGPIEVNPFLADMGLLDPASLFESAMPTNGTVRLVDITDGASNTLLLTEAGGRPGMPWASPTITVGLKEMLGGTHRGGVNVCLADGSVRWVSESAGLKLLGKLATRSGGETVAAGEY